MRERIIRVVAGLMVLISLLLVWYTGSNNWFALTVFVAVNLIQSSFTKWCLLDQILKKMGIDS